MIAAFERGQRLAERMDQLLADLAEDVGAALAERRAREQAGVAEPSSGHRDRAELGAAALDLTRLGRRPSERQLQLGQLAVAGRGAHRKRLLEDGDRLVPGQLGARPLCRAPRPASRLDRVAGRQRT